MLLLKIDYQNRTRYKNVNEKTAVFYVENGGLRPVIEIWPHGLWESKVKKRLLMVIYRFLGVFTAVLEPIRHELLRRIACIPVVSMAGHVVKTLAPEYFGCQGLCCSTEKR